MVRVARVADATQCSSKLIEKSRSLPMPSKSSLPFYDSHWLTSYHDVCDYLRHERPEVFVAFTQEMRKLEAPSSFQPIQSDCLFSDEEFLLVREVFAMLPERFLERNELLRFGRAILHDHPPIVELQSRLVERVGRLVGESVEPCYSFISLYGNLGVCELHLDAPSAKWTVDLCVDQSADWPIYFSKPVPWPHANTFAISGWDKRIKLDPELEFRSVTLIPGQAVVFCGSSQWHYRERIPRRSAENFCKLLFLHYRPTGSVDLISQSNWATYFAVPELERLITLPSSVDPSRVFQAR